MPFIDDFLDLLPHIVTVQRFVGRADDGVPQFSSPITYPARVNTETHNVIGPNNQLVVARGKCWLGTADPLTADDRVVLPDGTVAVILVVNTTPDEDGDAYTSCSFQ